MIIGVPAVLYPSTHAASTLSALRPWLSAERVSIALRGEGEES